MRRREPGDTIIVNNNFVNVRATRGLHSLNLAIALLRHPHRLVGGVSCSVTALLRARIHRRNVSLQLHTSIANFRRISNHIIARITNRSSVITSVILLTVNIIPRDRLTGRTNVRLNVGNSVIIGSHVRASTLSMCTINSTIRIGRRIANRSTIVSLTNPTGGRKHVITSIVYNLSDRCRNSLNSSIVGIFSLATTDAKVSIGTTHTTNVSYRDIILSPKSRTNCCPKTAPVAVGIIFRERALHLLNTRVINISNISGHVSILTATVRTNVQTSGLGSLSLTCTPPCSSTGSPMGVTNFVVRGISSNVLGR